MTVPIKRFRIVELTHIHGNIYRQESLALACNTKGQLRRISKELGEYRQLNKLYVEDLQEDSFEPLLNVIIG